MKRIALIRNSYSYDFGGAEIFPIILSKLLNDVGYETVLLSGNGKTLAKTRQDEVNAQHSPWWSFQNFSGLRVVLFPAYLLWMVFVTAWYIVFFTKNRIDVAHPQSRDDFIAATLAAKLLGRKAIWTDHADLKYIYTNHKVWYKNPVGKLVYLASLLADKVTIESFSESELIKSSLGKKLPKNYVVIYIGVVDKFTRIDKKSDKVVLVATSRLVKTKGIGELIEAFKSVDNSESILRLCGDGPEAAYFKSMAKDNENIEFLGHVDDVTPLLLKADIFVHPSYHEGFGLSLVEAEMCSLPIIACAVGSIPEIVDNGISGLLIQPKNVGELSKAIKTLIESPELRIKMGQAGRQIFLKNFQFDKIVKEKFIPIYEQD